MELVAQRDVVFNTGHVTGPECGRVVEEAARRGCRRILCPSSYYDPPTVSELVSLGAYVEFAFFVMSHATRIGQTMIDAEKHRFAAVDLESVSANIEAAGPARVVLASDSGSYVLAPPVEALREWLVMVASTGVSEEDVRIMVADNPGWLFKVPGFETGE